jgi:hypothetical protein
MDMDELLDMMIADESPSQISDAIKDMLFSKAAEKVDAVKPAVAVSHFGLPEVETDAEYEEEES